MPSPKLFKHITAYNTGLLTSSAPRQVEAASKTLPDFVLASDCVCGPGNLDLDVCRRLLTHGCAFSTHLHHMQFLLIESIT